MFGVDLEEQFGYMAVSDEDRDNENYFYATMGGEAMKEMLSRLNILDLKNELVDIVKTSKSKQKRGEALKRLKVVQSFVPNPVKNKINKVLWTTLDSLPILDQALQMEPECDKMLVWASFAEEAMKKLGHKNVETLHGAVDYSNFKPLDNLIASSEMQSELK